MKTDLIEELRGGLKKAFEENADPGDSVLICLNGNAGEALVATNSRVMILKAGYSSGAMFGRKVKSFRYDNISSVEFSCGVLAGRVQITVPGSVEVRHGFSEPDPISAFATASQAENVCNFPSAKRESFRAAANLIRERVDQSHSAARQVAATSHSDDIPTQIRKLAELKAAGVISEDEFAQKKAELLARM